MRGLGYVVGLGYEHSDQGAQLGTEYRPVSPPRSYSTSLEDPVREGLSQSADEVLEVQRGSTMARCATVIVSFHEQDPQKPQAE